MRLTELHADLQTLRENLAAELAAINRYEAQAFSLADERAQEVMQRIAVPMIGGMVSSTVLTLVVIPAIYAVVKGFAIRTANVAPALQAP